jgi:two-component sensor histidine kinase
MHQFDDDGIAGLLVSELVSNSLQHSDSGRPGGTITVTVAVTAGEVLIEVTDDGGAGHPVPRPASGDDDEDGRGLRLVQQLAGGWGYFGGRDRLSTWFQLKPPAIQPKTPARNGL